MEIKKEVSLLFANRKVRRYATRVGIIRVSVFTLNTIYRQYLKNHPELLDKKSGPVEELKVKDNKRPNPIGRLFLTRGGFINITVAVAAFSTAVIVFQNVERIHAFLTSPPEFFKFLKKLLLSLVYKIWPRALSDEMVTLKKLVNGSYGIEIFTDNNTRIVEEIDFDFFDNEVDFLRICDNDYQWLFAQTMNPRVTSSSKAKAMRDLFAKFLNIDTSFKLVTFLVCLAYIIERLYSLSEQESISNIFQHLIRLIKNGKIPKALIRQLIKRLMKKGIPIDIELAHLIDQAEAAVCIAE